MAAQFASADEAARAAHGSMPPPIPQPKAPQDNPQQSQPSNRSVPMEAEMEIDMEKAAEAAPAAPPAAPNARRQVPDGMLRFSTRDEVQIDNWRICSTYTQAAMHMDSVHAMPLIEDGFGMHGRRNGPWTMHMFYEQALAFASAYPTVQAETEAGSMCELKVTPLRIMEEEAAQPNVFATGPVINSYLKEQGGYLVVKLEAGRQFIYTHSSDVRKALTSMGVQVFSCSRAQVKMPDEQGSTEIKNWIPLGPGMITQYVSASIKPKGMPLDEFKWPALLEVETSTGDHFNLRYKLGGELASNLHADYDGCKKKLEDCVCPQRDDGDMRGPGSARPRSGYARPRPSEAFEKRADKRQKGLDMFYSSLASKDLPCPHFIDKAGKGRCKAGFKCKFKHTGEADSWMIIECGLPKSRETGLCTAAPHCIYNGCRQRQVEFERDQRARRFQAGSSTDFDQSEACTAITLCMQP